MRPSTFIDALFHKLNPLTMLLAHTLFSFLTSLKLKS
nr:MAG TPA: hypothetical protein [Caudoviricetes sp.]